VPIPDSVAEELMNYYIDKGMSKEQRISPYSSSNTASNSVNRTFKALGYNISIHELRHTYTTLLIESGAKYKSVAEVLGHSVEMTMSVYGHNTDKMRDEIKELVSSIF